MILKPLQHALDTSGQVLSLFQTPMSVDDPVAKKAEVKKETAIEVKVMLSKNAERHSVKVRRDEMLGHRRFFFWG